ncbi:Transmembrane channel-like protein 7 [Stylophora pistillata]|uniref:Transmembrane channel-like protein 7 n=1 Tax=Stylophora pistillata TaxID=50429 RepID=A0A2B4S7V7_STYPI|nr:Transmembrane channel-like protein 7 [Stylophora pistillata]
METISLEMHPMGNSESIVEPRPYMQDLPSRLVRHSASTVMRSQASMQRRSVGNTLQRTDALRRDGNLQGQLDEFSPGPVCDRQMIDCGFSTLPEEVLEKVNFKAVPLPMSFKRRFKDSLQARAPKRVSKGKALLMSVTMAWTRFEIVVKEGLYSLQLWRGHLKEIEGQFGSVICSGTPTNHANGHATNVTSCRYDSAYSSSNKSDSGILTAVLDFFTGQGWISNTIMFYSTYPSDVIISQEGVRYLLPLAYLLTGGAYFLFCLLTLVKNASSGLRQGYIESEGVFNSFCNRLFSAWDYCICERSAAMHKKQIIAKDFCFELEEEQRLRRTLNRTKKQKMVLYATRITINVLIVPALWYVSFVLVFGVIFSKKVTEKGRNQFEQMLIRSSLSLAITIPNLVLPPLFEFLSVFEDWGPKFELGLNLLRRICVKLPSIAMLMILLYKDLGDRIQDDSVLLSAHCEQCWENEIAAQMYMLVWVDFFVVLLITLGFETFRKLLYKHCSCFRKIGMAQFDISRNVIDLAYGQCLILIGTFFSPILPVIGVLKLIVFFYVKKLSLFHNNRLPDKPFQGAKLSSIFALLLLVTFLMSIGLVGWGVTRVPTSYCGPFKNTECSKEKFIIDELSYVVSGWPEFIHATLRFMRTAAFLLPITIGVLSLLYYYRSMAHEHRRVIKTLKNHLIYEGKFKKKLLSQLVSQPYGDRNERKGSEKYSEEDILLASLCD